MQKTAMSHPAPVPYSPGLPYGVLDVKTCSLHVTHNDMSCKHVLKHVKHSVRYVPTCSTSCSIGETGSSIPGHRVRRDRGEK